MAHVKAQGSSSNGRDSKGQRLGIKVFGSEYIKSGAIIVRQRGTKIHPGKNVMIGSDDTLFASISGIVKYERKAKDRRFVSVYPAEQKA